ncbi:basal cell adhesion molecule-like isoform X1 [Lethenteron reissneri]|uniref:basal cell adhesion molecule-like isoform X1 n=1 Tax=Lethenteron reissneri TaxID=7753 RepID=UPI002AB76CFE|nr:basal cell adhesion molecule-like isoform X1 [Lethenteron reissneri]
MEGALLVLLLATAVGADLQVSSPESVDVELGKDAVVPCTYTLTVPPDTTRPSIVVQWFMADDSGRRTRLVYREEPHEHVVDVVPGKSEHISLRPDNSLVLERVRASDEGALVCQVSAKQLGSSEAATKIRVYKNPELTIKASTASIGVLHEPGKVATCIASLGFPASSIEWLKDGELLPENQEKNEELYMRVHEEKDSLGLYTVTSELYYRPSRKDANSVYQCRSHHQTSSGVNVSLIYPTERLSLSVSPRGPVVVGDRVTLHCAADGNPAPEFTFSRSVGEEEEEDEEDEEDEEKVLKEELQTGMEPSWVLEAASQGDSGRYLCSGFDLDFPDLPRHHATISLLVHYLEDVWLSPVGPLTVLRGQDASLSCSTKGSAPIEYAWWKGSQRLSQGHELHLANAELAHSGLYRCDATMPGVPGLSRSATIKVSIEDKPSIVALDTVVVSSVDQQLVLSCQAHGPPSPIVTWNILTVPQEQAFANGSVSSSVEVIVTSELTSRGVACVATNAHGESEHRFFFSTADPTPIAATAAPQNSSSYLLPVVVTLVVTVVLVVLLLLGAYYWYRRQRSGSSNIDSKANSGQRARPGGVEEKKPLQDRSPDV